MRHVLPATVLLVSVLAVAQQPCPSGYHHEGNSSACWPDVSRQQQTELPQPPQSQPQIAVQAPQPKASIIFYRHSAFYGSALKPSVYVDGQEVGRLGSGRYLTVQTTVGPHALSSSKKGTTIDVTLGSDQTQYVEMLIQSGNWRGAGRLVSVPAEEGSEKTRKLKLEQ
jgi:Protein of unknown function (DUF2846)